MQRPRVVHGVTIVTGDEAGTLVPDGALVVVDDRIVALGRAVDVLPLHATAERNAYRALGVTDGGWLAPGNRADFIVVDFRRPHLVPALRPVSCFVHQGQAGDVESMMINGRWIMRDRRVLTLDEAAIVGEAERVARAAWGRLFAERPELSRPPGFVL